MLQFLNKTKFRRDLFSGIIISGSIFTLFITKDDNSKEQLRNARGLYASNNV